MKHTLLIIFLYCFTLSFFGQNYEWSKAIEKPSESSISEVIKMQDSSIVVIRLSKENENAFSFDVFDKNLFLSASGSTTLPIDKIQHIASVNNKIIVFGINQKQFQDKDILVGFEVDLSGETINGVELMNCKAYGGYHAFFDVAVSANQKFISIIGSEGYAKDAKEVIQTKMVDSEWQTLYQEEMTLNILSEKRRINVLSVNNQGVSYLIKRERIKSGDQYYLHTISKNGEETNLNLHLKSRKIVDMRFELDYEGNIYLVGFYAPPYYSSYEGVYIKKLNATGQEEFSKEYMLNANVIEAFKSKKDIKASGYTLDNFGIKTLSFVNEKNLILVIEEHHRDKEKDGTVDIRNGMVVFNFNEKGGFKFSAPIGTFQSDDNEKGYWSSHHLVSNEGKPLVYLNLIGEGAKKSKIEPAENAAVPIIYYSFNDAGLPTENPANFSSDLDSHCLYTKYNNKTGLPLNIIESLDHTKYAIGILISGDE